MKTIRHHPAVERELSEAQKWYEKAREGLGREFIIEVDRALAEIGNGTAPTLAHPDVPEVRRALLRRFPYWLVILERGGELIVLAVAHTRRRPGYWRDRVR